MTDITTRPSSVRRVKRKSEKTLPAAPARLARAGAKDTAGPPANGLTLGPLPEFLGYPLRRAQIAVFEDFMRAAGRVGLRPGQFSTLVMIDCNPGSKQSEVAAALGIQGTNFVALINHLEKRGLVERRVLDRRSYALHLTAEGKALLEKGFVLQNQQEKTYEDILGPGGRQVLLGLLARLTAGLAARSAGAAE